MAGLNVAKCPSCKILLLRNVQGSTMMRCPACEAQYGGSCSPKGFSEDNYFPALSTDQERELAAIHKHNARRHSFHLCHEGLDAGDSRNTISSIPSMPLATKGHLSGTSLHLRMSPPPDCKQKKIHKSQSNSESLRLPEIKDATHGETERSKLGRLKQFFSSSIWSRRSSPHSHCSSASSGRKGLELPPVAHRSSTEEGSSGSDCSLSGETHKKPVLTLAALLRQDFMAAKETSNYDYLQEVMVNTFNSWEEICSSFKKNDYPSDTGYSLCVDMDFVHYTYSMLMELPHSVRRAVMKATVTGLLKESKNHLNKQWEGSEDYLRVHLILLENPQFHSANTYIVFAQLLKQLSQLPSDAQWCLIHWLRGYRVDWFRDLIAKIQQFISIRLFPSNPSDLPSSSKCTWWIPSAVKVLALLNKANQLEHPPHVPYTEFNNSTLDHIDLMSEFYSWQSHHSHAATRFSFCQYPFILTMSAKKTILQQDSENQMLIMARRSLAEKVQMNQTPETRTFFLNLNVRRTHLVEDSINELMQRQKDLKKKVKVKFAGEPGLDMGGLTKEWFLLLVRKIFQPEYGLFTYNSESGYYWFNTELAADRENEYSLVGLLMGLAVYNNIILDIHFPPCCYKKLLSSTTAIPRREHKPVGMGANLGLDDLIQVMPLLGRGLKALLEYGGNVEQELCYSFQVSHEAFGATVSTNLLPNGNNIPVTSENRKQFVSLYVDHLLNQSIEKQFSAFYYGFHIVCDSNALTLFCSEEIEMLVCGCPEFDMHALESVTVYDKYDKTDTTIRNFWEVVYGFSPEQQRRLLLFVTGSNRVPVGGLSAMYFKISRLPFPGPTRTNTLPMAHTCFNHLLLPPYKTRRRLKEKLTIAISYAEGFGIE